ncbi:TetR/AcrR family transcriptional regulator [Microbacterium horticulturae]|uniref:TetR/AcrR family transcriptional regulator n=1 Tax=Microbacterium horticulturae TaxID=3028316 RepID=A0ABY8C0R0_9MICO|nr:TetR/AcrR family transcriptional regulator [Microbacterium sp. KACC 23027]WEG08820.1 TetR/AcrR family transcriptional regulator [Microbacterium sp. KACC 23027]
MTATDAPRRADARRNREAVLDAAGALFAASCGDVQMSDIAARAGVGVGTLYRHFADKQALQAAIIGRRFEAIAGLAQEAEHIADPWSALQALLYGYLEAAQADAGFRFSILSPIEPAWGDIASEKGDFAASVARIAQRAVAAGVVRSDFTGDDVILITRGAMSNMRDDRTWRRFVELALDGIRTR